MLLNSTQFFIRPSTDSILSLVNALVTAVGWC